MNELAIAHGLYRCAGYDEAAAFRETGQPRAGRMRAVDPSVNQDQIFAS